MEERDERDALQARVGNLEADLARLQAETERLRAEAAARDAGASQPVPEMPLTPPSLGGQTAGILSIVSMVFTHVVGILGFLVCLGTCSGPGGCDATQAVAHEAFTITFGITLVGSVLAAALGAMAMRHSRQIPGVRTMGIVGIVGAVLGFAGSFVMLCFAVLTAKKP